MAYHEVGAIPRYVVDTELEGNVFVPDALRRCAVFIGLRQPDNRFLPKATGFLVLAGEGDYLRQHLVTAEHVITNLSKKIAADEMATGLKQTLAVRFNMVTGGSKAFSLAGARWWSHPDLENLSDVATTPFSIDQASTEQVWLPLDGSIVETSSRPHLRAKGARLGQEIAIVGLFRHHYGSTTKSVPIVRVGNISAMPVERIKSRYCGFIEAFLIEARSISGLSGSPVFVNLSDDPRRRRSLAVVGVEQNSDSIVDFSRYLLLGLMHGHFDLPNMIEDAVTEDNGGGEREAINTGIGVVIPIQKIIETLYQPELVEMRKKKQAEDRKDGATPDVFDDDDAPPAGDANPKHREDFNSLVNAAARKREPKD